MTVNQLQTIGHRFGLKYIDGSATFANITWTRQVQARGGQWEATRPGEGWTKFGSNLRDALAYATA